MCWCGCGHWQAQFDEWARRAEEHAQQSSIAALQQPLLKHTAQEEARLRDVGVPLDRSKSNDIELANSVFARLRTICLYVAVLAHDT